MAFLRAALAASAAAIDMSSGGGHEDVVGDGSLGEDETGISSCLPTQAALPASVEAAAFSSRKDGDRSAGGRLLTSSFDVELLLTGLKSGSNLTMGGKSSDLTPGGSNDPGRGPTSERGGLGEPLLSFSSGVPSLDATPLGRAAVAAAAVAVLVAGAEGAAVEGAAVRAAEGSLDGAASCSPAGGLASELFPAGISGDEVREPPPAEPEPALRVSLGSRS